MSEPLKCMSPEHSGERSLMYFVEENGGFLTFACRECTARNRQMQIHVLSPSEYATKIRKAAPRISSFDRDSRGQVISFR